MDAKHATLLLKILPKIDRTGACWIWIGATSRGRPVVATRWDGKHGLQEPHRVIFQAFVGVLQPREPVFRVCGNGLCLRPDHLTTAKDRAAAAVRFLSFVEITPSCWLWKGAVSESGYAVYTDPETKKLTGAYRVALRLLSGQDIKDTHVHHRCRNRLCVRPDHLEKQTAEEHAAEHPDIAPFITSTPGTHCRRGHEYSPENTGVNKTSGHRFCRQCAADTQRASKGQTKRGTPRSHCRNGHPWVAENRYPTANGSTACRVCHRERERDRKRRQPP